MNSPKTKIIKFSSIIDIIEPTPNDITVNDTHPEPDTPGVSETYQLEGGLERRSGYVLVEEGGTLIMTNLLYIVQQQNDYDYNIIVRDQGTLILEEGSVLTTNGHSLRMVLYDDAELHVLSGSEISSYIEIIAKERASITIEDSEIYGKFTVTDANAEVTLTATNSTFYEPFTTFGGNSIAQFTDVAVKSSPTSTTSLSVYPSDNAVIEIYKWLHVTVEDGAGARLIGASVTVQDSQGGDIVGDTSTKTTDDSGEVLFRIQVNEVQPSENSPFYTISGEYNYDIGVTYEQDQDQYSGTGKASFEPFPDVINNIEETLVQLEDLTPDLVIADDGGVKIYADGVERTADTNVIGTLETLLVVATVQNTGTSDIRPNQDLKVVFFIDLDGDEEMDSGEKIGEKIDHLTIVKGESGLVNITWTVGANTPLGNYLIGAHVNPDQTIREYLDNYDDENIGSTLSTYQMVTSPDLYIENSDIVFLKRGKEANNATVEETILIEVMIHCEDADAEQVTATAYDGSPSNNDVIGASDPIALILRDSSAVAYITWDTTGYSIGAHSVYIVISDQTDYDGTIITDQTPAMAVKILDIRSKSDLSIADFILYDLNGDEITDNTVPLQNQLTLTATVQNVGETVYSVDVSFWYGTAPGTNQIGKNVTLTIPRNQQMDASLDWVVTGVNEGERINIYAVVNYWGVLPETETGNNIATIQVDITEPDIGIVWDEVPTTIKVEPGEEFVVKGWITYTESKNPFTDTIEAVILDDGEQVGSPLSVTPSEDNGYFFATLLAPESEGDYTVEVRIPGTTTGQSTNLEVKEEVGLLEQEIIPGIPFWIILLIIIIVVVAILVVGLIIGRFGLGKLVECGECGSFIPEGERVCPKCGTVFETDLARCSECNSWIPIKKKSCPECGAVFAGLEKEKKDYIETMKLQYVQFVEQFKPEAIKDLGKGMTDEAFKAWWKANPKYVGFEQWLQMEEEKKTGRTVACPSCGTINAASAKVCLKCGSLFETGEEKKKKKKGRRREGRREREKTEEPPAAEAPPEVVEKKAVPPQEEPQVVRKKVVKQPPVVQKKVVKRPPE
jgi:hypothetical protein